MTRVLILSLIALTALQAAATKPAPATVMQKLSTGYRVVLLEWDGPETPAGVCIFGRRIAWTPNGRVNDNMGGTIGTFERLSAGDRQDARQHSMLIFVPVSAASNAA